MLKSIIIVNEVASVITKRVFKLPPIGPCLAKTPDIVKKYPFLFTVNSSGIKHHLSLKVDFCKNQEDMVRHRHKVPGRYLPLYNVLYWY
jgi:hypothetical protein